MRTHEKFLALVSKCILIVSEVEWEMRGMSISGKLFCGLVNLSFNFSSFSEKSRRRSDCKFF